MHSPYICCAQPVHRHVHRLAKMAWLTQRAVVFVKQKLRWHFSGMLRQQSAQSNRSVGMRIVQRPCAVRIWAWHSGLDPDAESPQNQK